MHQVGQARCEQRSHYRFARLDDDPTCIGVANSVPTPELIFGSALLAHYRADEGLSFGPGGGVSAWADQSGNGRDLTQPIQADQPAYTPGPVGTAKLTFTSSQLLQSAAGAFDSLVVPYNLYFVISAPTGFPAGNNLFSIGSNIQGVTFSGPNIGLFAGGTVYVHSPNFSLNAPHVWLGTVNGASSAVSIDNGIPNTGNAGSTVPSGSLQLAVGNFGTPGFPFSGSILEALITQGLATGTQASQIGTYFNFYYGVP